MIESRTSVDTFEPQPNAFEEVVRARRRPGYSVEPVSIGWDAVAFRLRGRRDGIACIPRAALAGFFADLDGGRLDASIRSFLAAAPSGRVLKDADQTSTPGLFDELASPGAIVPSERVPGRGLLGGAAGGTPADARRNKDRRGRPRGPRRLLVAGGVVAAVVVVGAVALASRGGDDEATVVVAAPSTTTSTSTTTTTTVVVPFTGGTFAMTYTLASITSSPNQTNPLPVGDVSTNTAQVTCAATTCTYDRLTGIIVTMAGVGDHYEGEADFDFPRSSPRDCEKINFIHVVEKIDLQRDATGKVVGFTGTEQVTHRFGLDQPAPNGGTCSTSDFVFSTAGVPA